MEMQAVIPGSLFSFRIFPCIKLLSPVPEAAAAAFEGSNERPWQDYKGLRRSRYAGDEVSGVVWVK